MPDYPNPHDRFFRATFARREVAADFARHYLPKVETALRYMATAARSLKREELANAVKRTFPETGGILMQTIAQTWIEEGAVQTTRENILDLLEIRFGTVSDRVTNALTGMDNLARLKALHRQAVLADSLTEFEMVLVQSKVDDNG
jgi:hypothetical protein